MVSVAHKQSTSMKLNRENELKEAFDRTLESEKIKIDHELSTQLKKFEHVEKGKREKVILDIQAAELKLEKDKRLASYKNDVEDITEKHHKRLLPLESQLKEKYNNGKKVSCYFIYI